MFLSQSFSFPVNEFTSSPHMLHMRSICNFDPILVITSGELGCLLSCLGLSPCRLAMFKIILL